MDFYVTSHLSNRALRTDIRTSDLGESRSIAVMLSRIGEYDARKLFVADGYPSMRAYCMRELRYSEPEASKRIYAARTARKLPVLFMALVDGRLNLSGLVMLARHLTLGNVGELLEAARGKTNEEIAQLIAERFPRPDLPERLVSIAPPQVAAAGAKHSVRNADALFHTAPPCPPPASEHSVRNAPRGRMTPLSPQRFGFQFTGDHETRSFGRG